MASPAHFFSKYRFGAFELDAASGELSKAGIPIKLRLQAIQVLLMFVERAGQVVTREEIRGRLWTDDTFVDFQRSINFCVNQIRAALGDDAEKPRYVETLPRRGYRFIAPVTSDLPREPAIAVALPSVTTALPSGISETGAVTPSGSGLLVVPSRPTGLSTASWARKRAAVISVAVILAGVAIRFVDRRWLSRYKGPIFQEMQITKLTESGTVDDVAISPDGRYVVYARSEGEKQGLWLRQVATRNEVQILPPDTPEFHGLTFSPDGNYIYFVRSDRNDPWSKYLYSMSALGGVPQKLISDVDSAVSFSPDGREFAYEHCIPARNDLEVKIVNTDGSGDRLLTTFHDASCYLFQPGLSWSRDGSVIAATVPLAKKPTGSAVDVVSVGDGHSRELFSSPNDMGRPVWLVNGRALLVPRYDTASHRSQLWTISSPSGEAHKLTNDLSDYAATLDITSDGGTVAATVGTTVSDAWVSASSDLSNGQQITSGEMPMISVAEAPDGKLLSTSRDSEIWIMNPDGTQRGLFTQVRNLGPPTSCGRFILFNHYTPEEAVLMRADADGTHLTKLVSGNLSDRAACLPDGKFAFYFTTDGPQRIWRIPVDGGTPVEIGKILRDQITGRLDVSPDGRFLAYPCTQNDQTPSRGWTFAVIPTTGGQPVKQIAAPGGIDGVRWSSDGAALQYLMTRNGATNLWEQPLAGGVPRQITKFTSGHIFDFNWTVDGKRLLLTRGEVSSDVVLLSNLR